MVVIVSAVMCHSSLSNDGWYPGGLVAQAMRMERRKTTRQMPRRATAKPPPPPPPVETEYRGSACDRYNNLFHRINWKGRRAACNGCDGCIFVGRSVTGSCIERENMDQGERLAMTTGWWRAGQGIPD